MTFVSRVLPPIPPPDAPPLQRDLPTVDIASNYELVQKLEPFVRGLAHDLASLRVVVRRALEQTLPELRAHEQAIAELMAVYLEIYE